MGPVETTGGFAMASLEMNKIAAGILCAGLFAMVAGKVGSAIVHPEQLEENAYKVEIEEVATTAEEPKGPAPVEPILGMLAGADVAAGEKGFKKCAACHTVNDGGANKVGPNLYGVVNAAKGGKDGFAYSDALAGFSEPAEWTYSSLNKFLKKPKEYIAGTKMNYAGIKKASDRANMIAYLRSLAGTPAPLPTEDEIAAANAKAATGQ